MAGILSCELVFDRKIAENSGYVSSVEAAYKLIAEFETRSTTKFSCFKVDKDFGNICVYLRFIQKALCTIISLTNLEFLEVDIYIDCQQKFVSCLVLSICEAVRVAGICVVRKQANLRECQPSATRTTSGGMLKSMRERNLFLQVGGGGEGGYKACCNLHLATLVRELVLDFSPREKLNEHLPASFVICSRRFARFQHLTNISVIMYETVSPWYIFCTPTTVK